jgi:hypothetical protein
MAESVSRLHLLRDTTHNGHKLLVLLNKRPIGYIVDNGFVGKIEHQDGVLNASPTRNRYKLAPSYDVWTMSDEYIGDFMEINHAVMVLHKRFVDETIQSNSEK